MLTSNQRLGAYIWALKKLKRSKFPFICYLLDTYASDVCNVYSTNTEQMYPEFAQWKAGRTYFETEAWWPPNDEGFLMRLVALECCIEQLTLKQ